MDWNFFNITCFSYAALAVISRGLIWGFKEKWNAWELTKAYTERRPRWTYAVFAFATVFLTICWIMVFTGDEQSGWILATLLSLTLIKLVQILFNYNQFREWVKKTLYNPKRMALINWGVIVFAVVLVLMGIFLY